MKIIKQIHSLPIVNHDNCIAADTHLYTKKHGPLVENCNRCLIIGRSNCGKTNVLISMLTHPEGMRFENIYIYCKTLHQPKYEYLQKVIEPIKGMGFFKYDNDDDILTPAEARPFSIFIFDDVSTENQSKIRSFFSHGRHHGIDSIFCTQSYMRCIKHLLRDNVNFLILFKQDDTNLRHIFDEHVSMDMQYDTFKRMCKECWCDKYGFLVIDKDAELNRGRYRKGFDRFFQL